MVVDSIGRSFAGGAEAAKKLATGETSAKAFVNEFAEGLPIIGEFVKGWTTIGSLIDGSAKAEGELNRKLKEGAMMGEAVHAISSARDARLSAGRFHRIFIRRKYGGSSVKRRARSVSSCE